MPARSARQRELGQNFLVDPNILDVIARLAAVSAQDVVLEIGGGLGVLSTRLADAAGWVHVVEVDPRLKERLSTALAGRDTVTLHFADALALDLARLVPAPTKMVANLPYGVAATIVLKSIAELDHVTEWVVMVQREVGERFAAAPGTSAYGVPSVLAQLACEVKVLRPVSRTVFRPVPNVDSVLLGLSRRPGSADVDAALRAVVHGAFAHRRKALAGSLALSPAFDRDVRRAGDGRPWSSSATRPTSGPSGSPLGVPRARGPAGLMLERAPAKINLCLFLGPPRSDGRHRLVTVFDSIDLCDELELEVGVGTGDEVRCAGVSGPNLVGEALRALRAAGWDAPPVRVTIDKRIPVAAGMGGGSADAAAVLRCASRLAAVDDDVLSEIAAALGADVPGQLRPGPSLGTGAGEVITPLDGLAPYGVLVLPQPFALSTAAVYREADRLGLGRSASELERMTNGETEWAVNDLEPAALSLAPRIAEALEAARNAGADHALVCGSGPTVIGLFVGPDGPARAAHAAGELGEGVAATPVRAGDGRFAPND